MVQVPDQQPADPAGSEDDAPAYRVTHLKEAVADAFSDHGMVQTVAPLERGGVRKRVQNRVQFTPAADADNSDVERVLDAAGFAWTTAEPGTYVVLGREIRDVRELREGDRVHLNGRRGPYRVYRVMDHPPEVLQRSDPAVTVELANVDSDTDWMMVHWKNDKHPSAYVRTKDKHAKGGFRYKKVEPVEWMGRIGPRRLYAPSHDNVDAGYQSDVLEMVTFARNNRGFADTHPDDVTRTINLMAKPPAEAFTPADADTIREVLDAVSEYHERGADALTIQDNKDRAEAAERQSKAERASALADAFALTGMDAITEGDDTTLYVCEGCGKAYTDRFKYPTHMNVSDCGGGDE